MPSFEEMRAQLLGEAGDPTTAPQRLVELQNARFGLEDVRERANRNPNLPTQQLAQALKKGSWGALHNPALSLLQLEGATYRGSDGTVQPIDEALVGCLVDHLIWLLACAPVVPALDLVSEWLAVVLLVCPLHPEAVYAVIVPDLLRGWELLSESSEERLNVEGVGPVLRQAYGNWMYRTGDRVPMLLHLAALVRGLPLDGRLLNTSPMLHLAAIDRVADLLHEPRPIAWHDPRQLVLFGEEVAHGG